MSYYVAHRTGTSDELMHYGVMGMKWGVRRGHAQKAYEKASKKLNKLDQKIEKKRVKAEKAYSKYTKTSGRTGLFRGESDIQKAKQKYQTADAKLANNVTKANKWYKNMEKTFKGTDVSMTKAQQEMGQRYVESMEYRLKRSGFDRF